MLAQPLELQFASVSQSEINPLVAAHERYCEALRGTRLRLVRRRLDGLNLANRNLSDVDFSGCSMVGVTLHGARLLRANLYCADLRGADLQAAALTSADMRGACFRGANLAHAMLDHADLRAGRMMLMDNGDARVLDRSRVTRIGAPGADGVDFSHCSLKNALFCSAKLENANFSGAVLDGVKFKGAKLTNARFDGAVLTRMDLGELGLRREDLKGCTFDVTPEAAKRGELLTDMMLGHEDWVLQTQSRARRAVLDKEDLRPLRSLPSGRKLAGLSAQNCIAIGVNFSGSGLQAARFDGADLRGADFSDADLRGASFRGARLTHAQFRGASLGGLMLSAGGELVTDLSDAVTSPAQFLGAGLDRSLAAMGVAISLDEFDLCMV